MKAIKNNLLIAVVFILGTLTNYASIDSISTNTKKVKVFFENVKKGNSLTIKDIQGVVYHQKNIRKDGDLMEFFDFSTLKEGIYTVEVDKYFEILIKKIERKNNEVTMSEEVEKVVSKPIFGHNQNLLAISKINLDKSPLEVVVYCNDAIIVEQTIISEEELIEKVYKLDETRKGDYKVMVSNNNRTFTKEFTL